VGTKNVPPFQAMKISQEVRDYADGKAAIQVGMADKAKELMPRAKRSIKMFKVF